MYIKGYNVNSCSSKTTDYYIGESIEEKCRRITQNNEPITDGAPMIYTERADGVLAGYNIRTDRWEIAQDAMDKITKSKIAARENKPKNENVEPNKGGE